MIGIGHYEEHNSGLAAVRAGRVVTYAELERLTRVKNQAGWFPEHVARLLSELPLDEVAAISTPNPDTMARLLVEHFGAQQGAPGAVHLDGHRIALFPQDGMHPMFHLWSMFVLPGLKPGVYAVLVFDAEQPRMGWVDLREPLTRLPWIDLFQPSQEPWFNGELFADFFGKVFYGSRDLSHCGKLMGLASWGVVSLTLLRFLEELARREFNPEGLTWKGYDACLPAALRQAVMEAIDGDPWDHERSEILDLAATAQEMFRHRLLEQVEQGMERIVAEIDAAGLPPPSALLYSGGCALSVVTNRELRQRADLPLIVAPYAHDASQFLGSAVWASLQGPEPEPLPLGVGWEGLPEHTVGRITAGDPAVCELASREISLREVAQRIAAGELVALVQGGSEAGPRALGHRSLLANPLDPGMRDRLNQEVKMREWYRPFAAALTVEAFSDYFDEPASACAGYMLDTFRARPPLRSLLSSVTSPDGFSRAQAVDPKTHPWFHALLTELGAFTGHPMVLNTSLNAPGLPISYDLRQALADCQAMGIKTIVVDGLLIEQPWQAMASTATQGTR